MICVRGSAIRSSGDTNAGQRLRYLVDGRSHHPSMTCMSQKGASPVRRDKEKRVIGLRGLRKIACKPPAKELTVFREETFTNRVHMLDRLSYPRSDDDASPTLLTHLPSESHFRGFVGINPSTGKIESAWRSQHPHSSTLVHDQSVYPGADDVGPPWLSRPKLRDASLRAQIPGRCGRERPARAPGPEQVGDLVNGRDGRWLGVRSPRRGRPAPVRARPRRW